MKRLILLLLVCGLFIGLATATRLPLRAQAPAGPEVGQIEPPADRSKELAQGGRAQSVQDALLKPFRFPFSRPTSLTEVAHHLGRELGAPVVLDLAALERLELKPEDTVKLELSGIRLKTGLKLLLDQVGLTYRVIAEDNLLVLTDKEGAEDPVERVAAEVHELHRDIHDIQDAVDELREALGLSGAEGARVRKPTIIEEMPENPDAKKPPAAAPKALPRLDPDTKPVLPPTKRPRTRL
jgi:hypothetical protein